MRSRKSLALTLAAIAAVPLLLASIVWLGSRTGPVRRAVGDYLGELTGLPVTLGSFSVDLLPAPSLAIGAIAVGEPPGFGADPVLDIGHARVAFPWRTMLGGDPLLRSVTISDATARLAIAPDGSDNWSALVERLSELGGEGPARWSVERFDFERGALEFHDAAADSAWRLTAITIGATAIAPAREFPIELQLAGVTAVHTLHLALEGQAMLNSESGQYALRGVALRGWVGGDPLPLAGIEFAGDVATGSFDAGQNAGTAKGTVTLVGMHADYALQFHGDDDANRLAISVATAPFAPRVVATAFGTPLPATVDPAAFGTMQFRLAARLRDGQWVLDPIEGRLDDTNWSGRVIPQQRLVRIQADRLDADRYFAPEQQSRKDKKATLEALMTQFGELDVDAEIRIAEARIAGAKLQDALLKIERNAAAAP